MSCTLVAAVPMQFVATPEGASTAFAALGFDMSFPWFSFSSLLIEPW